MPPSVDLSRQRAMIVVVDDDEVIRYTCSRILGQAGYRVMEASTGEQAVLMAASHRPELIVLGVSLPDIDGLEVCRRLKADLKTSHIMVLQVSSTRTSKIELAAGLEGGADGYLIDPIDPLELLATVKSLLRLADHEKENRRLVQQLSRSERQFAEATSAADCGMWDWDIVSGKLEWFGAHERLAGMLPGGFSGKIDAFSEILHPDDRTRVWNKVQNLIDQHQEHFSDEYRFVHPDGSVHWMDARGRFFYDDTGHAVRMTGVVQDITERKRAEEFLRRITDVAPSILYVYDLEEGRNVWGNREMFAGLGYSQAQIAAMAGTLLETLLHPDDWPRYRTYAVKLYHLVDGEVAEFEYRMRRADGSYRWMHSRDMVFQRTHDGQVKQIAGSALDVTERKQVEANVRQSEEQLRRVLDAMHVFVGVLTPDGIMTQCNTAPIVAAGLKREEVIGTHFAESFWWNYSKESNLRIRRDIERAARGERVRYDAPVRVRNTMGETVFIDVDFALTPMFDETGTITHLIPIGIDVSARTRAESALRDSEQRLRLATEVAAIGVWEWNVVTGEVRWNTHMFEMYGIAPTPDGVVTYRTWREAVIPDDLPEQEQVLRDTIQRKGHSSRTFRITRQNDGVCRYIEAVETVRLNEQGKVEWVVGTNIDVTDRRQADDTLLAAHDTFRHLVEQSPFGVYAVDADFRLVQVSSGAQKVFAHVRPLLGRDFAEVLRILWPEPFASEAIAHFRHTLETGEPYRSSGTLEQRRDINEIESYDWKIERVTLPDGRFGVVCHFYDLSERQRYEQQLAAAKQQLEATLSATEIGLWHWDLTDNRLITDRNLKRLFDLEESEDPPVEFFTQRIHPNDFARNQAAIERVVQDGGSYDQQFRVVRPDGTVRWLHSRGKVDAGDGETRSFVGVVLDITERKQAEEQLRESEGRLQLALQASATGVWDWNLLTDEVTWSGHIHPIFGVEYFEGTREAFARQVHPEDADRLWATVGSSLANRTPFRAEFRIVRPTGEVRWVNNFGKAEYDASGQAVRLLGTVSDITERKVAEQELRQLKDDLEDRVRERTKELLSTQERLMAATSQLSLTEQQERRKLARDLHDYLAQMLIVGQMKTNMLKKQNPSDPGSTTLVQDLDKVFQDALVYTRTLIAELSPPSLHDSGLPAALTWLGERFDKDGLKVDVCADCASVPLPEEEAVVVFQAVRELLFNVMKHAGVDHATVTLSLSDDVVRVAVADKGKGLTSDALQRSAEPGHLGLVSVRERFNAMDGRVHVDSLPGQGTTVTLVLPVARREAQDVRDKRDEETSISKPVLPFSPVSRDSRPAAIRVLLVEDHKLVRQGLRDILASDDRIRVVGEAGTCEEAMMLAATVDPDVVITDINLPTVSGIEMTKRFKTLRPQMVVIGLSAHTEEHMKQDLLSAGAETLLSKECAAEELIPTIIECCSGRMTNQ